MAFAPIKRWKLHYITRWESFQNRNPPIISADEVTFAYDADGRIISESNPEGIRVFANTYDPQGRVWIQMDGLPIPRVSYFCYDESATNRLLTTVIDRTGAPTVYTYDDNYLLLSLTDALGNTTSYGYDTNGNQIAITNALGQVRRFT